MISHKSIDGPQNYNGVQVPSAEYSFIQRLAYKYNTSPRMISSILMTFGIHYYKHNKDLLPLLNNDFDKFYHQIEKDFR